MAETATRGGHITLIESVAEKLLGDYSPREQNEAIEQLHIIIRESRVKTLELAKQKVKEIEESLNNLK